MSAGMAMGFGIWSITAMIFVLVGISAWKSKEEVGFFTFAKPAKMNDVVKYNHAVGKLWFSFAVIFEIIGMPFLFAEQNSPVWIVTVLGVMLLVIAIMVVYLRIEKKYRKQ